MKRSFSFTTALAVGTTSLLWAAPALAQYSYDYSTDTGGEAAGLIVTILSCCIWIFVLVVAVFQLWMLIDAIMRQEHEFPNSSGNSKLIWILLMVFIGGASIFYYFMVFKKIKRGKGGQPPMAGPTGGYQPVATPPMAPPPMPPAAPPAPPMAPPAPPAPPMAPPAPPAPPAGPVG